MVVDENFITFPETIPEHVLWGEGREGGGGREELELHQREKNRYEGEERSKRLHDLMLLC